MTTAYSNMVSLENWLKDISFEVAVYNILESAEPSVRVDAFLELMPGFYPSYLFSGRGTFQLFAVASVVERTQW